MTSRPAALPILIGLVLLTGLVAGPAPVLAAPARTGAKQGAPPDAAPAALPAPVARLAASGATITARGKVDGLSAFEVLPASGAPRLLYATPQGGVIFGLIYDRTGQALTPPFSPAARTRARKIAAARIASFPQKHPRRASHAPQTPPASRLSPVLAPLAPPVPGGARKGADAAPSVPLERTGAPRPQTQSPPAPRETPQETAQIPGASSSPALARPPLEARIDALPDRVFLRLTDRLIGRAGFTIGPPDRASVPVVTAFLEPRCPYCRAFWQRMAPLARAGRLRLRILPIDIFRGPGRTARAIIAAAPDTRQMLWERAVDGGPGKSVPNRTDRGRGGQPSSDPARIAALIDAVFARWHPVRSAPFALWQGRDGALRETEGLPDPAPLAVLLETLNQPGAQPGVQAGVQAGLAAPQERPAPGGPRR